MIYVTKKLPPYTHQITLDEFLFNDDCVAVVNSNTTNTRTVALPYVGADLSRTVNTNKLIECLESFNEKVKDLRSVERHSLYRSFKIPKRSGGLRQINAPNEELMLALRGLKRFLEVDCGLMYHTSSFAYIKGRCTVDAVKRHQANKSRWFCKLDLSDFFGSTTLEFIMKMFSTIFPLSEIVKTERGRLALETALELAILDGGLPQGTPVSPTITNIMMIPIDHALCNAFREFKINDKTQKIVYTRYADDFLLSSRYDFDYHAVVEFCKHTLEQFKAPFSLNEKKTRYGSSAGSNWNLGVMLNKDNQITVGHKAKKRLQAMLNSYALDNKNGINWELGDVQELNGLLSYYRMVEGDTIDKIVSHMSKKTAVDIAARIKEDLRK